MIAGIWAISGSGSARNRLSVSAPSNFGIWKSRRRSDGWCSRPSFTASIPCSASRQSYPAEESARVKSLRLVASSSTTRTCPLDSFDIFFFESDIARRFFVYKLCSVFIRKAPSFPDNSDRDSSLVARPPMLEKKNSLPGAELHFSIDDRDRLARAGQHHPNV